MPCQKTSTVGLKREGKVSIHVAQVNQSNVRRIATVPRKDQLGIVIILIRTRPSNK